MEDLVQQIVWLRDRLEKELARGPQPLHQHGDTSAIGGWGKIGVGLEKLLRQVFLDLADAVGLPAREAASQFGAGHKPTLGSWLGAIRQITEQYRDVAWTSRSPLGTLVTDVRRGRTSALHALVEVRNQLQHPGSHEVSPNVAQAAIRTAHGLLQRAVPAKPTS